MDFRFLVICERVAFDGEKTSLHGVVDTIFRPEKDFPFDLHLHAAIGLIQSPSMRGKQLDLMAFVQDRRRSLEPQPIAGFAGVQLVLPGDASGACVCTVPITIPVAHPARYGFYLFDADGAFGKPKELMATYLYAVDVIQ